MAWLCVKTGMSDAPGVVCAPRALYVVCTLVLGTAEGLGNIGAIPAGIEVNRGCAGVKLAPGVVCVSNNPYDGVVTTAGTAEPCCPIADIKLFVFFW